MDFSTFGICPTQFYRVCILKIKYAPPVVLCWEDFDITKIQNHTLQYCFIMENIPISIYLEISAWLFYNVDVFKLRMRYTKFSLFLDRLEKML